MPKQIGPSEQDPLSVQVPAGMPGMLQYLGVVTSPPPKDLHQPIQGGGAGLYKVVLTLARPGQPLLPEGQFKSFEKIEGDSHLAIADPAYRPPDIAPDDGVASILFQPETEDGKFNLIGKPNSHGFLGQVIAETIPGNDAQDARTKVYRALASSLSNISIQLDMPLHVYQSDMIELSTGNRFISIVSPHIERPMQIAATALRANMSETLLDR